VHDHYYLFATFLPYGAGDIRSMDHRAESREELCGMCGYLWQTEETSRRGWGGVEVEVHTSAFKKIVDMIHGIPLIPRSSESEVGCEASIGDLETSTLEILQRQLGSSDWSENEESA
jgi:hypothetical protein